MGYGTVEGVEEAPFPPWAATGGNPEDAAYALQALPHAAVAVTVFDREAPRAQQRAGKAPEAERGEERSGAAVITPPLPSLPPGPLSVSAATAVVVKALLGLTLFSQPWASANLGVLVLPSILSLTAFSCVVTAQMLFTVRTAAMAAQDKPVALSSLPALVGSALGPFGELLAEAAVLCACFGILSAYLLFTSAALQPLLPAHTSLLLLWLLAAAAAALCLPRGMQHSALLSTAGNLAALLAAGGCVAFFAARAAGRGWTLADAQLLSGPSEWAVDAGTGDGVPVPAAALCAAASGFLLHFTLPALESAMSSPHRVMEAVGRGTAVATGSLAAFGALGVAALGADAPRWALQAVGTGLLGALVRVAAALDALLTAPVLCRPGLLVLEQLWERALDCKLGAPAAAAMRVAFVACAAGAASARGLALAVPFVGTSAALACTLVAPPLLLLLGCDARGEALVRTSWLERGLAGFIASAACGAVLFAALALAGDMQAVPFPYTAPPSPPSLGEYDYADYAPQRYAFSRELVLVRSPPSPPPFVNWSDAALWNHSWSLTQQGLGNATGAPYSPLQNYSAPESLQGADEAASGPAAAQMASAAQQGVPPQPPTQTARR